MAWQAGLHDAFYGVVTGAALSFDDQYLVNNFQNLNFHFKLIHAPKIIEVL